MRSFPTVVVGLKIYLIVNICVLKLATCLYLQNRMLQTNPADSPQVHGNEEKTVYEGPGKGSNQVPFGNKVAALVKSPLTPSRWYASLKK